MENDRRSKDQKREREIELISKKVLGKKKKRCDGT